MCSGGELAMACHLRLASRDAKLGLPEINIAAIPTLGGTQRLPKIIGRAKALELILRGRHISGDEAANIGLVNEACLPEELLDRAVSRLARLRVKASQLSKLRPGQPLRPWRWT
jgi:enoyl-CoA hydratase/carnithine racemase